MESAKSSLYRTFLTCTIPILLLLWLSLGLHAYGVLAGIWSLILVTGMVLSRRGLRGMELKRSMYPSAFEGDTVDVTVTLENQRRTPASLLEIRDHFGPSLSDTQVLTDPDPVPGRTRKHFEYIGSCSRHWGSYTVGPLELHTADPMGLFPSLKIFPDHEVFSVFPRVHAVEGIRELGARDSFMSYDATAGRSGQSLLYLGVRDYRNGDDPRRIHWPATARRGSLTIKEFEINQVPYFTLFLDLHKQVRAGTGKKSTLEYIVRTGASLLWTCAQQGQFFQVMAEGEFPLAVPPGRGDAHQTYALHELIQVRQDGPRPLLDVVEQSLTSLPEGSTTAMVFGTSTPDLTRLKIILERMQSKGIRPILVLINSHSFAAVEQWPMPKEEVMERHREIEFLLRSHRIPFRLINADEEIKELLARRDFLP